MATWSFALQYRDTLSLGSFGNSANWRLPSVIELLSLTDKSVSSPSIKATNFPATVATNYWSSSTYVASISNVWYVTFFNGIGSYSDKTSVSLVRCVASP